VERVEQSVTSYILRDMLCRPAPPCSFHHTCSLKPLSGMQPRHDVFLSAVHKLRDNGSCTENGTAPVRIMIKP
jgi:hypothetical protein